MPEVIRVENLSKLYDLGQVGTGTLSKDLNRWWASVLGKEDPYARIGQTNDRTKKAEKNEAVWALKDINFSVNQGEVVGIIGRNGAGKSTLLKIISRITTPTTGAVKVRGRIASLLEVGTGFHPEMTGRENVYMNGTLLGMTRREIQSKLDEIVAFAGVEMYIDTPVKRYSSGMQVRLAFAVAAFLEPEILIVDEVLAVGDAEFQRKAIGRMQEVSKGEGRTVLFVSHNMSSVRNLCTKGLLLLNGSISFQGDISTTIADYNSGIKQLLNISLKDRKDRIGNGRLRIEGLKMKNSDDKISNRFSSGDDLIFELEIQNNEHPGAIKAVSASIDVLDSNGMTVQLYRSNFTNSDFEVMTEKVLVRCSIKENCLAEGIYTVQCFLGYKDKEIFDFVSQVYSFEIQGGDYFGTGSVGLPTHCKILTKASWSLIKSME